MFQALRWYNLMPSRDDPTSALKTTWTTKTRHFCRMTSLLAPLKDLITNSKETDTLVTDAIRALRNGEALPMKSRILDWTFEEGLIFY